MFNIFYILKNNGWFFFSTPPLSEVIESPPEYFINDEGILHPRFKTVLHKIRMAYNKDSKKLRDENVQNNYRTLQNLDELIMNFTRFDYVHGGYGESVFGVHYNYLTLKERDNDSPYRRNKLEIEISLEDKKDSVCITGKGILSYEEVLILLDIVTNPDKYRVLRELTV